MLIVTVENSMEFTQKTNVKFSYDLAVPFLNMHIPQSVCTSVFIASLFVIVKRWKQLNCPPTQLSTYEVIKFIHRVQYYIEFYNKGQMLCDSTFINYLKKTGWYIRKVKIWLSMIEEYRRWRITFSGMDYQFWKMRKV